MVLLFGSMGCTLMAGSYTGNKLSLLAFICTGSVLEVGGGSSLKLLLLKVVCKSAARLFDFCYSSSEGALNSILS